jgi:exodeoxyribonuclease VIII
LGAAVRAEHFCRSRSASLWVVSRGRFHDTEKEEVMTDETDYREMEGVNISTLKELRKSPAHYVYRLAHPREDSTGLKMGRANHTLVFEPDKWQAEYAVYPGLVRRGKAWDAFEEANQGKTILKQEEYESCLGVRDAVLAHPIVKQYLAKGEAEKVLTWTDKETGLKCKARLDLLSHSVPAILDLKGSTSIDARIFGAVAARMVYHLQGAFYRMGARANGLGELPFLIIGVECEPPHDVAVWSLDEDALYAGEEECRDLLRRVAECRASGKWPGRYEGEQVLYLPAWAIGETEDDDTGLDLTVNGREVVT